MSFREESPITDFRDHQRCDRGPAVHTGSFRHSRGVRTLQCAGSRR
jgi:hypothetical protein